MQNKKDVDNYFVCICSAYNAYMRNTILFVALAFIAAVLIESHAHTAIPAAVPLAAQTASTEVAAVANAFVATTSIPAQTTGQFYKVLKVVDGDTFSVSKDGTNVTVRLIGMDTPEVVDPRKVVQCFGKEASAEAHRLLDGQSVRLVQDPTQDTYDKYGRLLAYAYLPDGTLYNKTMIEEGFAHEYTYNVLYQFQKEFKAAETDARIAQRGLWAPNTCNGNTTQAAHNTAAQPAATSATPADGSIVCSSNTYNCGNFTTHAQAQHVFDTCLPTMGDIHKLDSDGDGIACESLP